MVFVLYVYNKFISLGGLNSIIYRYVYICLTGITAKKKEYSCELNTSILANSKVVLVCFTAVYSQERSRRVVLLGQHTS